MQLCLQDLPGRAAMALPMSLWNEDVKRATGATVTQETPALEL